jgi:NAD(P)-dependent dehydrogenase (short-subunit alcohol dehydrogenase family)
MTDRLAGKVAIVTGAGSSGPGVGTGKAISILLAREGARVALVDLVPARAQETHDEIAKEGGDAFVIQADVTSGDDCHRLVAETSARWGGIHILVNNVGILGGGGVADESEEVWRKVLDVNLTSAMLMSKSAIPALIDSGGGSIVNISSVAALRGAGSAAYAASKAGMIGLTKDTALVYGPQGVRANCITPGHIYTPMVADAPGVARELRRRIGPLGTEGTAWDVGWAAVFLASDEARWITGVTLPVDAGTLAALPISVASRVLNET